jgi:hypothetical protein
MSSSNNNLKIEDDGRTDYNYIINYLLKTVNNKEAEHPPEKKEDKPVFLFEFFIFDLYTPKEVLDTLKQPLLSFRLLDFPTQTLEGKIDKQKQIVSFSQGKSCFFEMETHYLREYLINEPLYIMFVDMNFGDMKILGSSKVNISIFSYDSFLNYSGNPPRSRRNVLKLYDNSMSGIAEFDIALLIRREYFAYDKIVAPPKYETHIHLEAPQTYENPILFNEGEAKMTTQPRQFHMKAINKEEMIREISTMKETGVNTFNRNTAAEPGGSAVKLQASQYQEMLNPSGKNYTKNLKELIEGTLSNPPALFFHNKREREQRQDNNEIIVKVINENVMDDSKRETFRENIAVNKETQKQTMDHKNKKPKEYISIPNTPQPRVVKQDKTPKKTTNTENYDRKMKEMARYKTNSSQGGSVTNKSNNTSKRSESKPRVQKDFFEDDYQQDNDEGGGNEYYRIFNKIQPEPLERAAKHKKVEKIEENKVQNKFNNIDINSSGGVGLKRDNPVVCQSIESIQYASMKESRDYEIRTSVMLNIIGSSKELYSEAPIKESIMTSDPYKSIEEESHIKAMVPQESNLRKSEDYGSFDYIPTDSKI